LPQATKQTAPMTTRGIVPTSVAARLLSSPAVPSHTSTRSPTTASNAAVLGTGTGDLFVGSARQGSPIEEALGAGGSCIQGRRVASDGSTFTSFYVQADKRGTTRPATHFYDTGNYQLCGLEAGEWGIAVYAVNDQPTTPSEQARHQVRVRLSGTPGEIFYVDFRGRPGLTLPTTTPTPTPMPPSPTSTPGPYD